MTVFRTKPNIATFNDRPMLGPSLNPEYIRVMGNIFTVLKEGVFDPNRFDAYCYYVGSHAQDDGHTSVYRIYEVMIGDDKAVLELMNYAEVHVSLHYGGDATWLIGFDNEFIDPSVQDQHFRCSWRFWHNRITRNLDFLSPAQHVTLYTLKRFLADKAWLQTDY